jgi:adenine-specific DNA-methyltransferase
VPQKSKRRRLKVQTRWRRGNSYTVVRGDCAKLLAKLPTRSVKLVVTSPPYCIGKSYEKNNRADDFLPQLKIIIADLVRVLRVGGSLCWQVGYHVDKGIVTPLDALVYELMRGFPVMRLRNRIIWRFGHGLHADDRFSGRHETILWFTKGKRYGFNIDAVRELQKYPGKRHYKGTKKGTVSGNPKGKNPSDVWDIPNVKANHIEKTEHPCQFPVALAQRLVIALTQSGDLVLDPFTGVGSTGCAAAICSRNFVGAEISHKYHTIALGRIDAALRGRLDYRPSAKPVYKPRKGTPLTSIPSGWSASLFEDRSATHLSNSNGALARARWLDQKRRSVPS